MKILVVADGRSPTARHWLESLKKLNHQVILVSSYPCERPKSLVDFYVLPIAFATFAASQTNRQSNPAAKSNNRKSLKRMLVERFRSFFLKLRYFLGPIVIPYYGKQLSKIAARTKPDLVHALRIPYEGMTASYLPKNIPLAVSIWGNDLTLHASGSSAMKKLTIRTLERADGLVADTLRDIRLGKGWGFRESRFTLVVPGNGGIDFPALRIMAEQEEENLRWLPENLDIVVNPRGFRPGSVRNDTFFRSIPLILNQCPNTLFVCFSMANQPEALEWVKQLQIERQVLLLPLMPQEVLWAIFRRAKVTVSVSQHDGTPNSLLEAMACGCFPVTGDIESMREWIVPGKNGLLVDPNDPEDLARAVTIALTNENLRDSAAQWNTVRIRERADISSVLTKIEVFYNQLNDLR